MDLTSFASGVAEIASKDDHQKVKSFLESVSTSQSKRAVDKFLQVFPTFVKNHAFQCALLLMEVRILSAFYINLSTS